MVAREEGREGRARVVIKMVLEKGLGGVLAEKAKERVGEGSSKGAASSERSQLGEAAQFSLQFTDRLRDGAATSPVVCFVGRAHGHAWG